MKKIISIKDVRSGDYKLVERFFHLEHIGYYTNSGGIPQLCLAWVPTEYITISRDEWLTLPEEERGFFRAPGEYDQDKGYTATVMPIAANGGFKSVSVTLMNFRRYAWSYARGWKAEQGYARGVTYANRLDGGLTCKDVEQVIRESLVKTLQSMSDRFGHVVENLIYSVEIRPILDRMVEDAIEHANEHAQRAVLSDNGSVVYATTTISFDDEEVCFASDEEWKLPPTQESQDEAVRFARRFFDKEPKVDQISETIAGGADYQAV